MYKSKNLNNFSEFIYSDGFKNLSKKRIINFSPSSDLLIIVLAGLGSSKILKILENYPKEWEKIKNILLLILPHTTPLKIFNWASAKGWELRKEEYFSYNEKTYPLLLFSKGFPSISLSEQKRNEENLFKNFLYTEYWDNYYEWKTKFKTKKEEKYIKEWMERYSQMRLKK